MQAPPMEEEGGEEEEEIQQQPIATRGRKKSSVKPTSPDHVDTGKKEKNRVAAAASRARKKEYVQNLEKAIHVLTTEKLELQVKVATLTNQLWEQSIKIDELEKIIQELQIGRASCRERV